MKNNSPYGAQAGGQDNGPPGQNILGILLAATTSFFLTPYVFTFIGPYVEKLVFDAYGSRDFAEVMFAVSFILCGGVIYCVSRMIYWYLLAAIIAYMSLRAVGMVAL